MAALQTRSAAAVSPVKNIVRVRSFLYTSSPLAMASGRLPVVLDNCARVSSQPSCARMRRYRSDHALDII